MTTKDFEIGKKIYVKLSGNAARGKIGEKLIEEWEVTSIGRKYLSAKKIGWGDCSAIKFEIDKNFKQLTNYSVEYFIYLDKQQILDEQELSELFSWLRDKLHYSSEKNFSLEQLRSAKSILENPLSY